MSSPTRRSNSLGLWHVQLKHGLLPLTKPEVYSPGLKRRVPFFQLAVRCFGKRERPQETTALFFLHRLKNGSVSLHLALALPLSPSLPHSISFSLYIYVYIHIYIYIHRYTATTSSQTADAVHVGQILMLYESMFLTLLSRRKHLFFRCSSDPWQVWPKEQTWIKLLDEALSNSKPPNHTPFCVLQMSITLRVVLIYIYMHTCIQNFCVLVHISTCIRVCINTYLYVYIYIHIYIYIYTYIYIYIHTYSMMRCRRRQSNCTIYARSIWTSEPGALFECTSEIWEGGGLIFGVCRVHFNWVCQKWGIYHPNGNSSRELPDYPADVSDFPGWAVTAYISWSGSVGSVGSIAGCSQCCGDDEPLP